MCVFMYTVYIKDQNKLFCISIAAFSDHTNVSPYNCRDIMILELMKEITKMYLNYKQTNLHVVNTNATLIVYSIQDSCLNNSS